MAEVLRCCPAQSYNEPYIGVDEKCTQSAIFCIEHSPHKNTQGLMHQMLPLKHFKKTLQEKKFMMNEKIGLLIDQYNNLMDSLIEEIRQLKLRKNIQLSMLWLRQLAKDEEEYELMRQIYRMDFKDLTCALVHSIYFKIVHNQVLEKKSVSEINCYKGIAQILDHLSQEKQTRSFLSKKIAQIEGILENGQILKRALPDKLVFKENIKEVLLQSPSEDFFEIRYNKCKLIKNSRQYISVFSKYPIVHNAVYHINFTTKYTNVMLGVCTENLIISSRFGNKGLEQSEYNQSEMSNEQSIVTDFDKHYSKESLVFNCTNGCVYKDGMFQSGSSALTKGQKELVLKMRITSTNQLIILLGKNVLCRQKIDNLINKNLSQQQAAKIYLHILLRTEGDFFDVDRDKDISSDDLPPKADFTSTQQKDAYDYQFLPMNPRQNINFDEIKRRNEEQTINVNQLKEEILNAVKTKQQESLYPQIKKQVKKQTKRVEEKIKQDQEPKSVSNYKRLDEIQKQQKINEIVKRQRIDKILNDLKSKPVYSTQSKGQANSNMVARKLKESQQRKAGTKGSSPNAFNSKYKQTSFNPGDEHNQKNIITLKPITVENNSRSLDQFSYQASSQFYDQPMKKSNGLFEAQNKSNHVPENSSLFSRQQAGQKVLKNIKASNSEEDLFGREFNRSRPSQKIFNLGQDDQSEYGHEDLKSGSIKWSGAASPIDKIQEYQFARKKLNPPKLMQKFSFGSSQNQSKSLLSGQNENDESNVMETIEISSYERLGPPPKISINEGMKTDTLAMPQLKHSHFSKMTSQQSLINMEQSFGHQPNKKPFLLQVNSPNKKTQSLNPAIQIPKIKQQIQLDVRRSPSSGVFHIGNVIRPHQILHQTDQGSSHFDHSFDISRNGSNHEQSIINIRGTYLDN